MDWQEDNTTSHPRTEQKLELDLGIAGIDGLLDFLVPSTLFFDIDRLHCLTAGDDTFFLLIIFSFLTLRTKVQSFPLLPLLLLLIAGLNSNFKGGWYSNYVVLCVCVLKFFGLRAKAVSK